MDLDGYLVVKSFQGGHLTAMVEVSLAEVQEDLEHRIVLEVSVTRTMVEE